MSPLLTFTALRLGLFVLALVVLWGLGARDWLLLLLAAFVSMALSYVLLRGPRERLAVSLTERAQRRTTSRQVRTTDEDVEDAAVDGGAGDGGAGDGGTGDGGAGDGGAAGGTTRERED
ncbi:DUF4229 domain-containing protein [Thalassiella azotivora]